ncbi:rod shape-determining protein [Anaerotalea alkaliphila]|uniref:Cell shape-determining protein MreB n=1 Tax=Anaerotalea alkaliphila TaxID=2662126 RepID=A0A7X5KNP4_9FIRM|nr:rod shape-determining protein [Anaerotalea alkaliphila]NDL66947.1 rod shape-determining protein [Anaerotalea alkaliphila]
MFSSDIGVDLGTTNVLVYIRGKGVVVREPSVVAVNQRTKEVTAIGQEAYEMIGRTPDSIVAVRPLKDGVISNMTLAEQMLKMFIQKAVGYRLKKPLVRICVPSGVTEVERRAFEDVAYQAGARKVEIIEEPLAAAMGAGIDVNEPFGTMVVDIGGGTTDIAVISLRGTVLSSSIKLGGDHFDEVIIHHIRKAYNLMIGQRTAEDAKIAIGSVVPREEPLQYTVKGRSLLSGLPEAVTISSSELEPAMREVATKIVEAIHMIIEKTPPELLGDISERGMILTGGGSLLHGMDQLISSKTGLSVLVADDPMSCVVKGLFHEK